MESGKSENNLRDSGLSMLGKVPWGTHFCQFYQTKKDLLDVLVPYYRAGLENGEFCVWVTSEFVTKDEALKALEDNVPNFSSYLNKGQIEIFPYTEWYLKEGKFELKRVLDQWIAKYNQSAELGYPGMRVSGNPFWIDNKKDWDDFSAYEAEINNVIGAYKLIVLCTYSLEKCGASEVIDVVATHEFALIKKDGKWERILSVHQKKMEESLKESEERLKLAFKAAEEGVWDWDIEKNSLWFSSQCNEMLGYNGEDGGAGVSTWMHLVHPEDRGVYKQMIDDALKGKKKYKIELRLKHKKGHYVPVLSQGISLRKGQDGLINRIIGTNMDLTERKRMEAELKESEEKYRAVVDNQTDLISRAKPDGTITFVNPAYCRFYGKKTEELLGTKYLSHLLIKDQEIEKEHLKTFTKENPLHTIDHQAYSWDGSIRWQRWTDLAIFNEKGEITEFQFVGRDITESIEAEKALRESENRFHQLADSSFEGLVIHDNGLILDINKRVVEILGYNSSDLIGQKFWKFIDKKYHDLVKDKVQTDSTNMYEVKLINNVGKLVPVEVMGRSIEWQGKNVRAAAFRDITERKHAEEELRNIHEQLTMAQNAAGMGVWVMDIKTNKLIWSPKLFELFGLNPEIDMADFDTWKKVMHPDDRGSAEEKINDALKNNSSLENEYRIILPTGEERWIRAQGDISLDNSGNQLEMSGVCFDITERKKTEQQLSKQATMLSVINDAVVAYDLEFRIIYWNKVAENIFGYVADEVMGKNGTDLLKPKYFGVTREILVEKLKGIGHVETESLRTTKDGRHIYIEAHIIVLRDSHGEPTGYISVDRDITWRKTTEEELRKTSDYLENLFDYANAPIICWDTKFNITRFNHAFEKLSGQNAKEVLGKHLSILFPEDTKNESLEKIERTLKEKWETVEIPIFHKDGTVRIALWNSANIYAKDGKTIEATIAQGQDITERKRAEKKIADLAKFPAENPSPILRISADGKLIYSNTAGLPILKEWGSTVGEPIPKDMFELITDTLKSGKIKSIEKEIGEAIFDFNMVPVADSGYVNLYGRDITSRKKAENELQTILDSVPAWIFYKDGENRFVRVNKSFADAMGLPRNKIEGKSLFDFYPKDEAAGYWNDDKEVMLFGKPKLKYVEAMHTKEGVLWAQTDKIPYRDASGNIIGVLGLSIDVTERRKSELALQESEERFRKLSEAMPQLVLSADPSGTINYINRQACDYVGIEQTYIKGWKWSLIIHPDDLKRSLSDMKAAIKKGDTFMIEHRLRRYDGVYKWHITRAVPIFNERKEVIRWIATATDFDIQKSSEKELQKANRTLIALSNSNRAVTAAKDEIAYLNEVCKMIIEDCGHAMVWIGYAEDDKKKTVRPVASYGFDKGYIDALDVTWSDTARGRGPTGTAIRTGKPSMCRNMLTDPLFKPWRAAAVKRGYSSSVVFPLTDGQKAFGAISIYSKDPDPFTSEELKLLSQLAYDLSQGILLLRLKKIKEKSDAALLQAKEEWESTFDSVPDLIALIDSKHRIIRANKAMAEKLKKMPENCIGLSCYSCVHNTAKPISTCPHVLTLKDGKAHFAIINEKNLGGDFLISTTPIFDKDGKVTGSVHVARDISEAKKTEKELMESKERYRSLVFTSPDAVIVHTNGLIKFINTAGLKLLGASKLDDVIDQSLLSFIAPKYQEMAKKRMEISKTRKTPLAEMEFVRLDGYIVYVDVTGNPIMYKGEPSIQIIVRDITKRKQAEAEYDKITMELKKVQLAIENASDAIVITDEKGKIIFANKAIYETTGYRQKEVIGKKPSFWGGKMQKEFYKKLWNTIKIKGEPFFGEVSNVRKSGEKYPAEIHISPVHADRKGKNTYYVGIIRDITEQKKLDEAKTEFLSLTAHQLRTPLASISLTTELLLGGISDFNSKEGRGDLESIYEDAKYMSKLVSLFMDVSRYELGSFEIFTEKLDTVEFVNDMIGEMRSDIDGKKIKISTKFSKNIPSVNLDRNVMQIVLENLISNAIKYTPEKGSIQIKIHTIKESLIISVSDNGCGIPKREQSQIFSKLYRASNVRESKTSGVGLGLYLSKTLIEHAGGKLTLESQQNKGSTFTVSIPLSGMAKKFTNK